MQESVEIGRKESVELVEESDVPNLVECLGDVQERGRTVFLGFEGLGDDTSNAMDLLDRGVLVPEAELVMGKGVGSFYERVEAIEEKLFQDLGKQGDLDEGAEFFNDSVETGFVSGKAGELPVFPKTTFFMNFVLDQGGEGGKGRTRGKRGCSFLEGRLNGCIECLWSKRRRKACQSVRGLKREDEEQVEENVDDRVIRTGVWSEERPRWEEIVSRCGGTPLERAKSRRSGWRRGSEGQ
ncbi:UNVERIFIED_CONTAM: hypothetical protein PYX00_005094 [Menopon gallinae]|uniref:Uncharacterized protein n=1 Tax=Menopon gallinae TaxID=328185 RepID=A0AAW2HQ29_9NEOP